MLQLPVGAQGVALGVVIYSFICWICNVLMIWLAWVHKERLSYVACLSYIPLLSTTCSIIQQFHDYIYWEDIENDKYANMVANVGNPTLVIANGSVGADLVLFYIQYYCYIAEATFVFFWAFSLTQSVYGWSNKSHLRRTFSRLNIAGKIMSVVLPLVTVGVLQAEAVQSSFVAFLIVADFQFAISCAGGAVFLLMILWKYVMSRRQFGEWSVGYGGNSLSTVSATARPVSRRKRSRGVYDKWLVVRFTIAFVALGAFEISIATFQITGQQRNTRSALSTGPDLSASRARAIILQNLPGVSASLLPFIVFGTTKQFRQKMYTTFVPNWFRKEVVREDDESQILPWSKHDSGVSLSQRRAANIQVSKNVDISYSMNAIVSSPTNSDEDRSPVPPVPPIPTRAGPWEEMRAHGVTWQVSARGQHYPPENTANMI